MQTHYCFVVIKENEKQKNQRYEIQIINIEKVKKIKCK